MLLSLVFLFSLCACGAENEQRDAQPSNGTAESAVSFDGGDGTLEDPYRISTGEQMHELSRLANESYDSPYQEACYILMADVDLGGEATPWTPIGYGTAGNGFIVSGTFDGNGHTVSNMYLAYGEEDTPEGMNFGLFGEVTGTIENLTLSNSTVVSPVAGSPRVGGIAGTVSGDGELHHCHVTSDVTVTGCYYTGGLLGRWSGAILENCTNGAAMTVTDSIGYAGGILGTYQGTLAKDNTRVLIEFAVCENTGKVTGESWGAGGIIGLFSGKYEPRTETFLTDCINTGEVIADIAGARLGGMIGVFEPHHATAKLQNCVNSGKLAPQMATLSVDEARMYKVAAGGMIGYIGDNGMFVDPDDDCGVSHTAAEFESCINQGQIVTHEDGQEYLIDDIVGCTAVPATEK